ncbi:MAG: hypothetical protein WAV58_00480 [Lactococcus raffinolactis]
MNKTDWIEYFEAINSRKPSEEEISQALAAGEFSETVVVEAVEDTTSLEKAAQSKRMKQLHQLTQRRLLKRTQKKVSCQSLG